MNQELFNKFKIASLTASGFLLLWYFFDVNISKIQFIKDIGLDNQKTTSYLLVVLILFCSIEGFIEFSKSVNKSWQSNIQLLTLILLPLISIIIAYPKIASNSVLHETSRFDIIVPLISSLIVAFLAFILNFEIATNLVFLKLRKTLLPVQIAVLVFLIVLIISAVYSTNLFSQNPSFSSLILRNAIFAISFIIAYIILSPNEDIFTKDKREWLTKKSESLDRQVETYDYSKSLRKPLEIHKKKIHKNIMKTIEKGDEERMKSVFPRFIMLKELSFKEEGAHFVPANDNIEDEELAIRVNIIQKIDGSILETEDVKFKYVKLACQDIAKISVGNDIRSFLTPMASKAYYLQSLQEHDKNELMLKLSTSDENLSTLKELFKNRSPNINYLASNGWSALLISVANGEEKTARYLLQKAADPSVSSKHGASPLHFASKYGKLSLCKLLINYQADINQIDIDGSTPLMLAARFGHGSIVELLIQNGADINISNDIEKTALTYATEGNYGEICRKLKRYMRKN